MVYNHVLYFKITINITNDIIYSDVKKCNRKYWNIIYYKFCILHKDYTWLY